MPAHAVDHHEQRCLVVGGDGGAILIVFSITDQTEICILDPQARAPAGRLILLFTLVPTSEAALYTIGERICVKTAFALIPSSRSTILGWKFS